MNRQIDAAFHWVGGATWILRVDGVTIACDPVLCPAGTVQDYGWFRSRRLEEPVYTEEDFRDVDLWLITHTHEDHLDAQGLAHIGPASHVVTHANALTKLRQTRGASVIPLAWRQQHRLTIKGCALVIEAMPAVHGVNPVSAWVAGGVNGYWVTITREDATCSFYVTGDTVTAKPVLNALQGRRVDILIPHMGAAKQGSWIMALTLSARMLRQMKALLQPTVTVPVHFGTFEHYVEPIEEVAAWDDETIRILAPGQRCPLTLEAR
jgi:L-ascorbate metabolism protein UlaG (beta-lactamase superfamily)